MFECNPIFNKHRVPRSVPVSALFALLPAGSGRVRSEKYSIEKRKFYQTLQHFCVRSLRTVVYAYNVFSRPVAVYYKLEQISW